MGQVVCTENHLKKLICIIKYCQRYCGCILFVITRALAAGHALFKRIESVSVSATTAVDKYFACASVCVKEVHRHICLAIPGIGRQSAYWKY